MILVKKDSSNKNNAEVGKKISNVGKRLNNILADVIICFRVNIFFLGGGGVAEK